jgi:hypothetical protein
MAYIGKQPVVGNFVKLDAITTSATATYNLLNGGVAYFPQTANNCIVSLNGVIQSPTSAYTISGSTIVFSDALTASDSIDFILVLGDVLNIGTPSDGTITSAKLASGLVVPVGKGGTGLTALGTASQVLRTNSGATALEFATISGTTFGSALLHVRDEKANGTNGGTFTSGAWQTRTLNTSLTNEISGASLSSNQIILPSGTYYIHASAPAYSVDRHKLKLRNTTDSSDTLIGTSEQVENAGAGSNRSFVIGRFTIAAQKTFELQHRCTTTISTNGFGLSSTWSGEIEVYTDVQIWKVA